MGALDLSCTLAESSENTKAKDVLQVHRACGDELEISFRRTIRVPDGKDNSELPPDLGTFPLYSAADYQRTLPQVIAAKGGGFFPMYRKLYYPD